MLTGINGALGTVVTFAFISLIIDRVGRKKPLIFGKAFLSRLRYQVTDVFKGAFGMVLCLSIEAAINAVYPGETSTNTSAQTAGVAFIFLFGSLFFSVSFGPVSWV